MSRLDYSELAEALSEGDVEKANELLKEVIPRLEKYLRVVMGASDPMARECVQQAFLDVYERIRMGNILDEKYIFGYLIKSCRNEYLHYTKRQHRFLYDSDSVQEHEQEPMQIESLMDKDRQRLLEECLDELDEESRDLITHYFKHPDATTKEVSRHFKISEANVRTKKSRITYKLHLCYKWKSSQ